MKFTEALKLENFKAHYDVIVGNINDANGELNSICKRRDEAQEQLYSISELLSKAKEEYDFVLYRNTSLRNSNAILVERIFDQEQDIANRLEAITISEDQMSESKKSHEDMISKIEDRVQYLTELVSDQMNRLYELSDTKDKLNFLIRTLSEEVKDLNTEKDNLLAEMEHYKISHKDIMASYEIEIADIQNQIEESKKEVVKIDGLLEAERESIKNREEDVVIMTHRLQKMYQEIAPDMPVKI